MQNFRKITFRTGSRSWKIAGISVSSLKGTTLNRIKNILKKKFFSFPRRLLFTPPSIYIQHLFPLFSSFPSLSPVTSFLTARANPHENVTTGILSYAVPHLHEGTGKLRKTCADTVGHLTESVPSLKVSEK